MNLGFTFRTNHDRRLWFVLILFVAAVLLPTACVLWLISDSISKQRQISKQQLADAYRSQLKLVAQRLDQYWSQESARLEKAAQASTPAAWAAAVRLTEMDSVLLYGPDGRLLYPVPPVPPSVADAQSPEWMRARQLEERFRNEDATAAAAAYAEIAAKAQDTATIARALQSQIRCLRQGGNKAGATSVIVDRFVGPRLQSAQDAQGRVIAGDALLMAIQVMPAADGRRLKVAEELRRLLTNYESISMPSAQRLFLMKEMKAAGLPPPVSSFPTLQAEELAAKAAESGIARSFDPVLRPAGMKDVWMLGSQSGRVMGLLQTSTVKDRIAKFLATEPTPSHVRIAMIEHNADASEAIETVPAGAYLPAWRIALFSANPQPDDELARRQRALYIWTGTLILMAVLGIAFIAGRMIHRQMRLANLKSDLVATVSHELKTPLASIRLLLDTLLDQDELEPVQTREYLELMERENSRLTQMIENFLAFSRLERNRYNFRFAEACPAEIVDRAMEAFAERAAEPNVRVDVEVAPDLPALHADPGALSTVLINLLDNAYKYTSEDKRIALRAFRHDGSICFEVKDNGIGVPKSEMSKVFRDFYQVDSRLARSRGGCGLGLAIVKFIVDAHRGSVSLDSQVGQGSTFKVAVPWTKS
jgi:signal transduction histidine kinase